MTDLIVPITPRNAVQDALNIPVKPPHNPEMAGHKAIATKAMACSIINTMASISTTPEGSSLKRPANIPFNHSTMFPASFAPCIKLPKTVLKET